MISLWLTAALLTTFASSDEPKGVILQYDAAKPKAGLVLLKGSSNVRKGEKVWVKIVNANTATHKYSGKLQVTNEYTSAVPKPFADLVIISKPQTVSRASGPVPGLGGQVKVFYETYAAFAEYLAKEPIPPGGANLDTAFANVAISSDGMVATYTNTKIYAALAETAKKILTWAPKDFEPIAGESDQAKEARHLEIQRRKKLDQALPKVDDVPTIVTKGCIERVGAYADGGEGAYLTFVRAYDKITEAIASTPNLDGKVVEAILEQVNRKYEEAKTLWTETRAQCQTIIAKAKQSINIAKACKELPDEFYLGPFEADGDVSQLILEVTPSELFVKSNTNLFTNAVPTVRQIPQTLDVYGRKVLDFSVGLVGTTFERQYYHKRDKTDDAVNNPILNRGPRDRGDVDFATLAHYYETTASGHAIAPSIGLSVKNTSIRALLGLSYVMGNSDNRTYFTVGLAFGEQDRINGYTVGDVITEDVKTVKVNRTGYFIGVSFNFISK